MGKFVMYEFVIGGLLFDLFFLFVCNLWNIDYYLGGLLLGVGVVVVVGLVLFVIGMDMVGLVCNLVSVCGIVGFKLICSVLFCNGVFLLVWIFDYVGILGCSVDDVDLVYVVFVDSGLVCIDLCIGFVCYFYEIDMLVDFEVMVVFDYVVEVLGVIEVFLFLFDDFVLCNRVIL